MVFFNRRSIVLVMIATLVPAAGSAQDLRALRAEVSNTAIRRGGGPADNGPFAHSSLLRVVAHMHADRRSTSAQQSTAPKHRVMGFAIAVGIGAGVSVAGLAAAKYSENEGPCGRCFAEWSAIAAPVGAGVGAAIGYLIDRARR